MDGRSGFMRASSCAVGIVAAMLAASACTKAQSRPVLDADLSNVADRVSGIRVFLTEDPGVVVGEVVTRGLKRGLTEIALSLEEGRTTFLDTGKAPDRVAGDGVFTARIPMNTAEVFRTEQARLDASTAALLGEGDDWVLRGSRDSVPARIALRELRATKMRGLESLAARTRIISAARSPLEAAKALKIDVTQVPFLEDPTGRFSRLAIDPRRLFDIPFFPGVMGPPVPIDEFRSLMIIDSPVLDDPARTYDPCTNTGTQDGVWSFAHLIRELSAGTGLSPEDYLLQWLATWQSPQLVNDVSFFDQPKANSMNNFFLPSWLSMSGGSTYDIDRFPARLLAIVNRPDLADKIGYGAAGSAGEARLVFGLGTKHPITGDCTISDFTVIFEYAIAGGSCSTVKAWHKRWKNLDTHPKGSAAYRQALEQITLDFTESGTNPAQLPNQSSLAQLRTNDGGLTGHWQLREFHLQPPGGSITAGTLAMAMTRQQPLDHLNGTATLEQYLIANESDILADTYQVPARYPTSLDPFQGAAPFSNEPVADNFWTTTLTGLNNPSETRRKFSLGTCDSCHDAETGLTMFTHIGIRGQRAVGQPSTLSMFLTGTFPNFNVPVTHELHHYADLEEREKRMSDILATHCFPMLAFRKVNAPH